MALFCLFGLGMLLEDLKRGFYEEGSLRVKAETKGILMTKRKTPKYREITNGPIICEKKDEVMGTTIYRIRYDAPLAARRPGTAWIKSIRTILGLKQEELAELLDVSWKSRASWEQGLSVPGPGPATLLWDLAFRICVVRTTQLPEELARTVQIPEERRP